MKAIVTKYHGPTDTKGSRFSAVAEGCKRMTVPYDYSMSADANHHMLALRYLNAQGWGGRIVSGGLPDGRVAHVIIHD